MDFARRVWGILEQPDGLILAAAQQFHSVLQSEVNEHPVLDAICSGSS